MNENDTSALSFLKQYQHFFIVNIMKPRTVLPLAASVVLAMATLNGCADKSSAKSAPNQIGQTTLEAVAVKLAPVLVREATSGIRAIGILSTKDEIKLSFKIGGVIASISVRDGDVVRKGQTLAHLNLAEINAQVAQAQQGMEKAKRDLQRAQNLYKDSVITLEQVQNAATGYSIAQSTLQIATFNQQYATIVAPTNGRVLKVVSKAGELAGVGSPIVVVSSESSGWVVRVGLSDRDVVRLHVGDKAMVRFDAFPNTDFSAIVSDIAAAANQQTGTFEAELKLQPNGKKFVTGLVASADITPSTAENVAFVPIEAIVEGNGMNASVYALSENDTKAKKLPVQIAFIQGNSVAVKAGLQGVSAVVTDGVEYLADGAAVRVVGK